MKQWIVLYVKNARIGSFPLSEKAKLKKLFPYHHVMQVDPNGTEFWNILAPAKEKDVRRIKLKSNPSQTQTHTLGRILEIRYERTTGRKPGLYKHVFKRGNGVLKVATVKGRKVIIVEPK